jgi:hypothetical protein
MGTAFPKLLFTSVCEERNNSKLVYITHMVLHIESDESLEGRHLSLLQISSFFGEMFGIFCVLLM